ncbi:MAG: hypothetical protein P4N59_14610 [Negativicutes bacterium]|nr:hypothetical protein [Negativicutes bacterium]
MAEILRNTRSISTLIVMLAMLALPQSVHATSPIASPAPTSQSQSCATSPPAGSYYMSGDCTPVALDTCATAGVGDEFIKLLNAQAHFAKRVKKIQDSHIREFNTPVADFTCHMEVIFLDDNKISGILEIKNHYASINGENIGSPVVKARWRPDCWKNPGIEQDICPKKTEERPSHGWRFIGNGNGLSAYLDENSKGYGSITPDHPVSKSVLMLLDYNNAQLDMALPYLSSISRMQFDCATGQMASPYQISYDSHMARGYAVFEQNFPIQWQRVSSGSISGLLLSRICGSQAISTALPRSQSYRTGQADRINFNNWFGSLSGSYRDGAKYLADIYFQTGTLTGNCMAHWTDNNAWAMGCNETVKQLAVPSVRRRTDTDYRQGWDGNTSPLSP